MRHKFKSRRRLSRWTFVILVSLFLAHPSWLVPQDDSASQENSSADNPPSRVARISYLKGSVSFLRAGTDQWSEAGLNFPATTGDRIYTRSGARAELEIGPYTIRLWENTDVTITNLHDQIAQLGSEQGGLRMSVAQLPSGDTVEVDTPNGAVTVLQPGKYRIDAEPNGGHTMVSASSGGLEVSGAGISQAVEEGQAVELAGQDPVPVSSVSLPPLDNFDIWSEERDERLASSGSRAYVSPATPGYADLDENGHWSVVADYGPVWYPPVPVGWVPYRVGHWVWIDPWGWTWMEDEPWGFCPFHYGRWVQVGAVWGWLPGPIVVAPVYAPALVAFLGGPHFSIGIGVDLVGWFPLGPGEPFFPWYHHSERYLREVNVTNIRNVINTTNIINISNINNIHYAYKTVAATAVPKSVLSSGQPVAHQIAGVSSEQLAKAEIAPHPMVNPTKRAVALGRPVPAPPVRPQHLIAANGTSAGATWRGNVANPSMNRQPGSLVPRSPEAETLGRMLPPEPSGRAPTPMGRGGQPRMIPPRFITKAPPPPPPVPFLQKRPAMFEHPGRALEPAQLDNLRAGRPVGPMRDQEFPPHAVRIAPERPSPALPRAPRPRH